MKVTSLAEANKLLAGFVPNTQTTNWTFSLEQMEALMLELGNPQDAVKTIHVAGTSGKTSTAYYITDMLRRSGKKVGLTVSPHIEDVNERVQINGQPLPEAEFCQLFGEFLELPAVKQSQASYFGVLIAFAFWVFARLKVDYAVIEVGLGGRLDSTNVIHRPDKVAVITDIGFDHMRMLGNTITAIASEKAGIIQTGNHVFMHHQDQPIEAVVSERAQKVGAPLTVVPTVSAPAELPLFQQRNWSLAQAAVSYLAERDGLTVDPPASAAIHIPARMETVSYKGKTIILDGAHNSQKITALCQSIAQKYPQQKLAALVGFTADKDELMTKKLSALQTVLDHMIVTTFRATQDMPRWSIEPDTILAAADTVGLTSHEVIAQPEAAFRALLERPEPVLLITGSFFLVNRIRPLLQEVL